MTHAASSRVSRYLILTAQVVSVIFSPFYLPLVAFVMLLFFSYLRYTPLAFGLRVVAFVFLFTILLPKAGIYLYRKVNGWTRHQLSRSERRIVPYLISICCYAALLYKMHSMRMPRFTLGIVAGALGIQLACVAVNNWVKVSTHAAAGGAVIGAVVGYAFLLGFDPTWPVCLATLLCGVVCTARLILRQHTLTELGLGVLIGIVCAFWFVTHI